MTTKISFRSSSIYLLLSSTFPSSIYNSRRKVERIERHPSTGIQLSHPFPRTFAAQKFDPSSTRDPQKAANNRPNLSSLDPSLSLSLSRDRQFSNFSTLGHTRKLEMFRTFVYFKFEVSFFPSEIFVCDKKREFSKWTAGPTSGLKFQRLYKLKNRKDLWNSIPFENKELAKKGLKEWESKVEYKFFLPSFF